MSEAELRPVLWLVPGLPLLAAAVIAFLGPALLRRHSHWPCILGVAGSFIVSVMVFLALYSVVADPQPSERPETSVGYYTWVSTGLARVDVALRVDPLSVTMACMVSFISSL